MSTTTSRAEIPPGDDSAGVSSPSTTAEGSADGELTRALRRDEAVAYARTAWPYAACVLAALLAWPSGWAGQASWWHLPLLTRSGAVLLLGAVASGLVVAALVREPWPRVGIIAGVAGLSWLATDPPVRAQHGRLVLAGLLVAGILLGLALGARARRGVLGVSSALAILAGMSPSSWPHAPLLAVAVALPFWLATRDRVAPTLWAVVRAVLAYVVARVVAAAFTAGWVSGSKAGLEPVQDLARRVASATWETLRHRGFDTAQTALTTHTWWIWSGIVLAVWLVVARVTRRVPRR